MDKDPELSILLAQESIGLTYGNNSTVLSFSNTALRKVTDKSRLRLTFRGHDVPLSAVRYSPDGNRIVSGAHRTIKIWMAETGAERKRIFVSSFRELEPQWTENRNDSSGQYAVVWNIETGHQIIVLNGHDATVYSAAYSPDGQRIVTSRYDGTSKVWNAQTGRGALTLIGHYDGRISRI